MHLYFIAVIPDEPLRTTITSLKQEMNERFHARHALKSPAHITMQMPFKRNEADETSLIEALTSFTSGQTPFNVKLNGFGCFTPRVIYVAVQNPEALKHLHHGLKRLLLEKQGFDQKELSQKITPHMTIATRDLDAKHFYKAWPEFEKRGFKAEFTVNSLFLLKHNGKFWDILREFEFN